MDVFSIELFIFYLYYKLFGLKLKKCLFYTSSNVSAMSMTFPLELEIIRLFII